LTLFSFRKFVMLPINFTASDWDTLCFFWTSSFLFFLTSPLCCFRFSMRRSLGIFDSVLFCSFWGFSCVCVQFYVKSFLLGSIFLPARRWGAGVGCCFLTFSFVSTAVSFFLKSFDKPSLLLSRILFRLLGPSWSLGI